MARWRNSPGSSCRHPAKSGPLLARFVNDLENLPTAADGASLGGLSPRLEAELIAMLTRPQQSVVVDRSQTAAVFTMLGIAPGACALAAVFWINGLTRTIQNHTDTIEALKKTVAEQSRDIDEERVSAKEEALNAILGDVRIGAGTESFLAQYTKLLQERDEAIRKLDKIATDKDALNEMTRKLRADNKVYLADLKDALAKLEEVEETAEKESETSEARIEKLRAALAAQEDLMAETEAGTLSRKYRTAWYVAAGGIAVSVLLGLGLVVALARTLPEEEEPPPPIRESPRPPENPPHQIS